MTAIQKFTEAKLEQAIIQLLAERGCPERDGEIDIGASSVSRDLAVSARSSNKDVVTPASIKAIP